MGTINDVTTFEATPDPRPIAQVMAGFEGRHTGRTLAAARRIRAKTKPMKLPANLLKAVWRLTGGWLDNALKSGWGDLKPDDNWRYIQIGESDLVLVLEKGDYYRAVLLYRGYKIARFQDNNTWTCPFATKPMVAEVYATLGIKWNEEAAIKLSLGNSAKGS